MQDRGGGRKRRQNKGGRCRVGEREAGKRKKETQRLGHNRFAGHT